jgi:hypothetical protein
LDGRTDNIIHHHHHGYATTADPAAAIMIENIKHTVEKIHHDKEPDNTIDREIVEEEEAKAEQEIKDNIKSYLSRTDQFASRMNKIMH